MKTVPQLRRMFTKSEMLDLFRPLVTDQAALKTQLERLYEPICTTCGTTDRVFYAGPSCHKCYAREWKRDKRLIERADIKSNLKPGQAVIWSRRLDSGKQVDVPATVLNITHKRIIITVAGEAGPKVVKKDHLRAS